MSDHKRYVVCIRNEGYEGALEIRKIYESLLDESAAETEFMRVIDESGEDYLYPINWFLELDLPRNIENALAALSEPAK